MKKILLSSLLLAALSIDAQQTQAISFEASEGYTLGILSGQQDWIVWGGLLGMDTQVTASTFTDGARAMYVESYGDIMDYCGIEKPITPMTSNKYSISFDYKHEGFGGSDYQIDFYNVSGTNYNIVSAVGVGFAAGAFKYANMGIASPELVTTTTNIAAQTWANFKIVVDKQANTLEYFVNNASVGTSGLGANQNINLVDFTFDDYGTGFYVDNIVTTDMSNLSVEDTGTKENVSLTLYPNPASDFVNIKIADKVNSVEVFDLSGKLMVKDRSGKNEINIQTLTPGNYLIKVNTEKSSITKKFTKK